MPFRSARATTRWVPILTLVPKEWTLLLDPRLRAKAEVNAISNPRHYVGRVMDVLKLSLKVLHAEGALRSWILCPCLETILVAVKLIHRHPSVDGVGELRVIDDSVEV